MKCLISLIFNFYLGFLELLLDHLDAYALPEIMKSTWYTLLSIYNQNKLYRMLINASNSALCLFHGDPFNIIKFGM